MERKERRRQGVREHYSVESDALPENEQKKGITRRIIRSGGQDFVSQGQVKSLAKIIEFYMEISDSQRCFH